MAMAMGNGRHRAAGSHTMPRHQQGVRQDSKYQGASCDHDILSSLHSARATPETPVSLGELLGYRAGQGTPSAVLRATAIHDESVEQVAAQWNGRELPRKKPGVQLRCQLRAWAYEVQWAA